MENKAKLSAILEDAIQVITNPVEFYRTMPKTGGFADPVIFVLVMAVMMGFAIALFSAFGVGMIGAMAAGFGAIIFIPIFALMGSFIGAAILFVIWKLMGSSESFEAAYRCVAYAAAIYPVTVILGLIPYIGSIVGVLWSMYLMMTASLEVHQLNQNATYTVFGILGALMIIMNISTEMSKRKMASQVEDLANQIESIGKQFERPGAMTPEQAGKSVGDFIKGLSNATKEINNKTDREDQPPAASESTATDADMTPEQAGKALGDFLKGFGEATRDLRQQPAPVESVPVPASSSTGAAGDAASEQ